MPDWRVLIVDDDTTAARIHARLVGGQPRFTVVTIAVSAEEAQAVLRRGVPVDLILLDVELPGSDGVTLLRRLRARGGPEVIAITATRAPEIVADLVHLGIVDYLVKPFVIERLQLALLRFRDRKRMLDTALELDQERIDRLYAHPERSLLPKGLQRDTLEAVRSALRDSGVGFLSADQVAREAAVARVTARRYLEYLVSSRQAESDTSHGGPGRPLKLYRLATLVS